MQRGEFEWIESINKQLRFSNRDVVVKAIGDDAAVIKKNETTYTVISTDALVEGIHFDLEYFSFFELGQKAMAVNLSDMAAMGAKPQTVLVSLVVPQHINEKNILDFYSGLEDQLQLHGGVIVGGDTTRSRNDLIVNLTITGECDAQCCKFRHTAQRGDAIYVTGPLGMAALGLVALENRKTVDQKFISALKTPTPRVAMGLFLASQTEVHAMMDLSDGLFQDLGHILKASQLSAEICVEDIPTSEHFDETCVLLHQEANELKISGGEDYQLLFTVASHQVKSFESKARQQGFSVYRIGQTHEIVNESSCRFVYRSGATYNPKRRGYDHFKESV